MVVTLKGQIPRACMYRFPCASDHTRLILPCSSFVHKAALGEKYMCSSCIRTQIKAAIAGERGVQIGVLYGVQA
jgi:hypothetical protein